MINENDGIIWVCDIGTKTKTVEEFKTTILWFIIRDHGKDTRDAILALNGYFTRGNELGYPVNSIMKELLPLASEIDKYGFGSMKRLIRERIK